MQSIKNAVFGGSSDTTQSGQEPVSGQTGSGTTSQPYDGGNVGGTETFGAPPTESNTTGSENIYGRDRGGPTPGNEGPHATSIANKLDPRVDSDGDGKPKSGPTDYETTTGQGSSSFSTGADTSTYSTGQSGTTGEYDDSTTARNTTGFGSTGGYDTSTTTRDTTDVSTTGGYGSSTTTGDTTDLGSTGDYGSSTRTGDTTDMGSRGDYDSSTTTRDNADMSSNTDSASRYTGQADSTAGPSSSYSQGVNTSGGEPRPLHDTDKTGVMQGQTNDPKFSDEVQTSTNDSSVADRGQDRGPTGGFGAVEPSVGADPSSGQQQRQKQQGGDRPLEEPSGEEASAISKEKQMTENAQAGGEGSADGSHGPGSGAVKHDQEDHSGAPLGTVPHGGSEEERKPHPGQEGGEKSRGTGEQWVKSSGLAADGGDFDATKPGAGREADRLLEQKGIHRTDAPGGGVTGDDSSTVSLDSSGKPSMGQKLMDKLHMGKK
ncbi:hypothetical protein MMC24_006981 [Lignoscripta atroalba]|nr:hypothetical protein [Lignoscripta atroalba]